MSEEIKPCARCGHEKPRLCGYESDSGLFPDAAIDEAKHKPVPRGKRSWAKCPKCLHTVRGLDTTIQSAREKWNLEPKGGTKKRVRRKS